MAQHSIPVDLANPGQVFACYGFAEAADILLGGATAAFEWAGSGDARFRLAAAGDENPVERVLRFLDDAEVEAILPNSAVAQPTVANSAIRKVKHTPANPDSYEFPVMPPDKHYTLPVNLVGETGTILIDHWGDDQRKTGRDNVKFWAGQVAGSALVSDALALIGGRASSYADNPFAMSAPQASNMRFDSRSGYMPLDIGFSIDRHKTLQIQGYPVVDILAAIGLTNARPFCYFGGKLCYSYVVAGMAEENRLYDLALLRLALGAEQHPIPGMPFRKFQMQLDNPAKGSLCITNVLEITGQYAGSLA